jgi:hypothetical protein
MDIDLTTISAAVTVAKTAVDTLKTAFSAKEKNGAEREVNEAFENLGKVQDKLIELRGAIMSLQDENHRLFELRAKNGWSEKAARYELNRSAAGGDFAYLFIGEVTHWACPTCFELEKVSVLQPWDEGTGALRCHVCKTSYHLEAPRPNNSHRL